MKKAELPLSIRAYAKALGVDEKAVRKAITEGKIVKGIDKKTGKIIRSKADAEWGQVHELARPQRGVSKARAAEKMEAKKPPESETKVLSKRKKPEQISEDPEPSSENSMSYEELIRNIHIHPTLTYAEALRRKEILNIAGERMKLEEQQGLLVRKADVEKSLFALGDMLKKSMLNVPNRCIDDIMTAPNKVEATNILIMEINSVFTQFAQQLP